MSAGRGSPGVVLGPALLLGAAGDLMFFEADGLGLNASLWIVGTVLGWVLLRRRSGAVPAGAERTLLLAVLAIAAGIVWRANPMLIVLNGVALLTVAVLLPFAARPELGVRLGSVTPGQALRGFGWLVRTGAAGLAPCALDATRQRSSAEPPRIPLAALLRGGLLAVPVLLIFGALLGQADPAFGSFLRRVFRVDLDRMLQHALLILLFAWLAAGLLVRAIAQVNGPAASAAAPAGFGLGPVELVMLLGGVDLLFLGFVVFQLPYFFGDQAFVLRWSGGTLADYARRGFFELVVLSAMVLPLLLAVHARLSRERASVLHLYRWLAGGQVALLLVIIASAMHRMALYQGRFGLTQDRFFASSFIAGLAVTSGWFALTMLRPDGVARGGPARFMSGTLAAWAVWLALLHVVNPDRIIVETNLRRAEAGRQLDAKHLGSLSADALPAIAAAWDRLSPLDRTELWSALTRRKDLTDGDWRSWNLARAGAGRLLTDLSQRQGETDGTR